MEGEGGEREGTIGGEGGGGIERGGEKEKTWREEEKEEGGRRSWRRRKEGYSHPENSFTLSTQISVQLYD